MLKKSHTSLKIVGDILFILFGVLAASVGLKGFLLPNGFFDGGAMGVSLLLNHFIQSELSIFIVVVNIPFVLFGFRQISHEFAIKSAIAIILLALSIHSINIPAFTDDLFVSADEELVDFLKLLKTMTKTMRILIWSVVVLLSGILSSCTPKSQNDCGFVQNIYGQRISWKAHLPIKVYLNSSVPPDIRPAIYRAAATWEHQIGRKVFEISEDSSQASSSPARDQKNAIYFLPDWESDKTSEQGRTSVYWAGDEIQEADIRINAADFSYYDQNPQVLTGSARLKQQGRSTTEGYSFEALVLHEMGHFLGLKHREGSSVMATYLAAFANRVQLVASDQEAISCEYK